MANVPEGAQLSEDGHYWWDGAQWQSVAQDGAAGAGGNGATGADGADGGAAAGAEDPQRVAARTEAGLPGSLFDVSDEQRGQYMGEAQTSVEVDDNDEVDVVAMNDSNDDGSAVA